MINIRKYNGKSDFKSVDVNKLIILAGAGISIVAPTKLPSGKILTEYYLESSIEKELSDAIVEQWEKLSEVIYRVNGLEKSLIRLEFIIGCINEIDIEFGYYPFIAGFKQFVNVDPNINHVYLAELLKSGCEIITPNFDCSIEKVFDKFHTTVRLGVPVNEVKNGVIYHYHGIGAQYKQLGATIREIKKGLLKEFSNQLKTWFEQGYSIIAVGFSCSDYFDMTPFFETLERETYNGTAIFFQHGTAVEKDIKNKINKFYSAFRNKKILYGDTSTFLSDLSKCFGTCDYKVNKYNEVDWKTEFEYIRKMEKRENLFYLIKLLNHSGLNLSKAIFENSNKPKMIQNFNNMNELLEFSMEKLSSINKITYIDELNDRSKSIFSDIVDMCRRNNYVSNNFREIERAYDTVTRRSGVRKEAKEMKYNELIKHIKKSKLVPENFVTIYVYAFNRIAKEKIIDILSKKIIFTNDKKVVELYECAQKMLKLPFNEYEYISYYISIYKVYNILCIMLQKKIDINTNENFLVNIALEICGTNLVIKIYFNTVLQNIMLFFAKGELTYLRKAKKRMLIIKECIEITQNYNLMHLWEKNNTIIQIVEKVYKNHKRFDYNRLIELIQM